MCNHHIAEANAKEFLIKVCGSSRNSQLLLILLNSRVTKLATCFKMIISVDSRLSQSWERQEIAVDLTPQSCMSRSKIHFQMCEGKFSVI